MRCKCLNFSSKNDQKKIWAIHQETTEKKKNHQGNFSSKYEEKKILSNLFKENWEGGGIGEIFRVETRKKNYYGQFFKQNRPKKFTVIFQLKTEKKKIILGICRAKTRGNKFFRAIHSSKNGQFSERIYPREKVSSYQFYKKSANMAIYPMSCTCPILGRNITEISIFEISDRNLRLCKKKNCSNWKPTRWKKSLENAPIEFVEKCPRRLFLLFGATTAILPTVWKTAIIIETTYAR